MKAPGYCQARCNQSREFGLHDTSFVMALFRPWVGKQKLYLVQGPRGDLLLEYFHRVVRNDFYIGELGLRRGQQQMADTGLMYFNAQEIPLRLRGGTSQQVLPV